MRLLIFLLFLAAIVLGVVGLQRGWFSISSDSQGSKSKVSVTIDKEKWQSDRDEFLRQAKEKLAGLDEKLKELRSRSAQLGVDMREKTEREIDDLQQKRGAVQEELKDAGKTAQDRWEALTQRLSRSLESLEEGYNKARSRFNEK